MKLTTLELDFLFVEDSQVSNEPDEANDDDDDDGTTQLLERIADERDFYDCRGWW